MRITINISFVFILIFCFQRLNAQDPHLSQPFQYQQYLNPALTGYMKGNLRLSTNYRNQWSNILGNNAFNTYAAALNGRLCGDKQNFGYGIRMLYDRAGSNTFEISHVHLAASYFRKINKGGLGIGVETGAIQHAVNFGSLNYDRQFNDIDFDQSISNGENLPIDQYQLWDINAGIFWIDPTGLLQLGLNISHINEPNADFFGGALPIAINIDPKFVGHARFTFPHSSGTDSHTKFIISSVTQKQGSQWQSLNMLEFQWRQMGRYHSKEDEEIWISFGSGLRTSGNVTNQVHIDAIVLQARANLKQYMLGVSYDLNVSTLSNVSNFRGAFELAMSYTFISERNMNNDCIRCSVF